MTFVNAGAGDRSRWWACTHHPTHGQPPPAPPTAPAAAPITTAGDAFSTTLMGVCSALEARAPTAPPARPGQSRWGSERPLRGVSRGQGSGQANCGNTVADSRASQAKAAAAPCSSSSGGDEATHAARSRDPRYPRPQSPGFLDGDSPLNAAPAKPCGFHVTYGAPWRLRHL